MSYTKRDDDINNQVDNQVNNNENLEFDDDFSFDDFDDLESSAPVIKVKKSKAKKSVGLKILSVFLAIVMILSIIGLIGTTAAYFLLNRFNIVETEENYEVMADEDLTPEEGDNPALDNAPKSDVDLLESLISSNIDEKTWKSMASEYVYNVLLIGSDTRIKNERGRSDTMIIASLNKKTGKIFFTSILRDTYVAIPNRLNNRINAAYALGGAELLMDTIELNFKIHLDEYMMVDFDNFIEIIDTMGGVDLSMTDIEIDSVNSMSKQYCAEHNLKTFKDLDKVSGEKHLNGVQALMYSRIRKSDSDFARTGRQRLVLQQLIVKSKSKSITELYGLAEKLMPLVTTNITDDEMFYMLLQAPTYLNYMIIEQQVPVDGTYSNKMIRGMAILGIDNFDANISMLQDTVFESVDPVYIDTLDGEKVTVTNSGNGFRIEKNIFLIAFLTFGGAIILSIVLIIVIDKVTKNRKKKYAPAPKKFRIK
jgi:LCP family protein required for cell wall assembly